MSTQFVSIGMPVYNAGGALRHALDGLLAQTHTNFELIISDNASTDGLTEAISREYAARDSRIRLTRQPVNQGAINNFMWVLGQARAEYFMWAAHDDFWSSNYVESLARRLDEVPAASLATSTAMITVTEKNGEKNVRTIPAAPNGDRWATLKVYTDVIAGTWFYGLYRTEWIRKAIPELKNYPSNYGDWAWTFGHLLDITVVGCPNTTFFYDATFGKYKDLTYRRKIELWGMVAYHTTRLAWTRLPMKERPRGLYYAWRLVYLHHVCRGNPIGTAVRAFKLAAIWCWFALEAAARRISTALRPVAQ